MRQSADVARLVLTLTRRAAYRKVLAGRRFYLAEAGVSAAMRVDLLVLNYNGRRLLEECLPSLVAAAAASRHAVALKIIDNSSSDDSLTFLAARYPQIEVVVAPNRGLASFNAVVAQSAAAVAVLLNNDIKLHPAAIDPLVAPLDPAGGEPGCFLTAPLCWRFDGTTYEGQKTAVRWRWGVVQATAFFRGFENTIAVGGRTASAGSVLAVDCHKFQSLGGFDSLYFPGRIEDLDFAYRGYVAGYHARYVPASVAYHRGMATFGAVFGQHGCDALALRNTLLFQWKNLRRPEHLVRQAVGVPLRLARDCLQAPWVPGERRWVFTRALWAAIRSRRQADPACRCRSSDPKREKAFFDEFHPASMAHRADSGRRRGAA